jgi:hypothetical protein
LLRENQRPAHRAVTADDVAKLQTILQRLWSIRGALSVGDFPSGAVARTTKVNKTTGNGNKKKAESKKMARCKR